MNVTPDLLERYALGLCTPAERRTVKKWLSNAKPEDIKLLPLSAEELQLEEQVIWEKLQHSITQNEAKIVPLHKTAIRYASAACVAFALLGTLGHFLGQSGMLSTTSMADNSAGKCRQTLQAANLKLELMPHTKVSTHSSLMGAEADFRLCGAMILANESCLDRSVNIIYDCPKEKALYQQKVLRKGKEYLVFFHDYNKEKELYVIELGRIDCYPPSVQHEATALFKI